MRVWDCFPYWREDWAIEVRLRLWKALAPEVEYIPVAFFGDRTHRGDALPEPVIDPRCRSVRVTLDAGSPWGREMQQRDAVRYIRDAMDPEDLVLLTDADEFVNPGRLEQIQERVWPTNAFVKLSMALYFFGPRWYHPTSWNHPGAFLAKYMPLMPSATIRLDIMHAAIGAAGWHVTYVGDVDAKLKAFAHVEMDDDVNRRVFAEAQRSGLLDKVQLQDLPIGGVPGDIMREVLGI